MCAQHSAREMQLFQMESSRIAREDFFVLGMERGWTNSGNVHFTNPGPLRLSFFASLRMTGEK